MTYLQNNPRIEKTNSKTTQLSEPHRIANMLEYFTYKKVKKHRDENRASASNTPTATTPSTPVSTSRPLNKIRTPPTPTFPHLENPASPVLTEEDENFLHRFISAEGTPPPLPERRPNLPQRPSGLGAVVGDSSANELQMVLHEGAGSANEDEARNKENRKEKGKGKQRMSEEQRDGAEVDEKTEKVAKKWKRLSFLHRKKDSKSGLAPTNPSVPDSEATREEDDLTRILDDLNLSAHNNRAFSLSPDSTALVQKFTVILKDLINGVPTAYDDLVHLLDDAQPTLAKSYDSLPSFLQKLITQLPSKVTSSLAPELLAVATEAQAMPIASAATAAQSGGMGAAAKSLMSVASLKELVTKPGAVVGMLKSILNALKLRWPAFMGTNVLLSLALFVLLFVFWYCYKRGKEVRMGREGMLMPGEEGRLTPGGESGGELGREGSRREGGPREDGYKARRDARQREKDLRREAEGERRSRSKSEKREKDGRK
ncbi:RING-like domain-containing protein [Rutstroemia sp. NJR-2017a BVV2]|nr:RING-like domain-containing protein [Rutstroemia sp. NJR-2017a BVV2]